MSKRAMMTWLGLGAALVLGAGAARADEGRKDGSATSGKTSAAAASESAGAAGSATASSPATPAEGTKELRGRVLQASPSRLFVEHMGAVVEFRLDSDAQFSGGNVSSASDLAEGQEVRASFTVENKTTNVAKRISVSQEAGGAGTSGGMTPPPAGGTPPREPSTAPAPK